LSCQAKVEQLKNVKRNKHHFVDLSMAEKINQLYLEPQKRLLIDGEARSSKMAIGN
jgi:hypothetical protein